MTHADIPLPIAVRRLVDLLLESVGRGLRGLRRRYGAPDEMRRSNADAFADLAQALAIVRRLGRMLRYVLLILALEAPTTPARHRCTSTSQTPPPPPPHTRAPRFVLATPCAAVRGAGHPQPAHLAQAARPRLQTLARHVAALTHALRNTMPLVRRLARRLAGKLVVLQWRPPKRPPRFRVFWEEMVAAYEHAAWSLRRKRRSSS